MLRGVVLACFAAAMCLSSQAGAGGSTGPNGGGFYNDIYRDGGCWYAGYNHCRYPSEYTAAPYQRHFAVWRGCYRLMRVSTERGSRLQRVFVCPPIQ